MGKWWDRCADLYGYCVEHHEWTRVFNEKCGNENKENIAEKSKNKFELKTKKNKHVNIKNLSYIYCIAVMSKREEEYIY